MVRNVLLIRYGEVHLKGQNRSFFMRLLKEDIQHALADMGATVSSGQGRFYASGYPKEREDEAVSRLSKIFGLHSVSRAREVEKDWEAICDAAKALMEQELKNRGKSCTFKVFARRSDKTFPLDSMALAKELGHVLLEALPGLKVDVVSPQVPFRWRSGSRPTSIPGRYWGRVGCPRAATAKRRCCFPAGSTAPWPDTW